MPTYFKKYVPRQPIFFSDGSSFNGFIVVDHECGILATENEGIIKELRACIRGQRGGVEEISGQEFLELQSKKKGNLKPLWREEWQPRRHQPTAIATLQVEEPAAEAGDAPRQPPPLPANSEDHFKPTISKM